MKKLFRTFVIETFSLQIVASVAGGLVFEKGFETLFFAGVCLAIGYYVIKPAINLLLLPLNLITFGLFRWVSSAIALYLVTLVVQGFKITNFVFAGTTGTFLDLPSVTLEGVGAFVAFSFLISFITGVINWLIA